jgi:hypothetical protein
MKSVMSLPGFSRQLGRRVDFMALRSAFSSAKVNRSIAARVAKPFALLTLGCEPQIEEKQERQTRRQVPKQKEQR